MKLYKKKQLKLKEMIFKKKDVVLKEYEISNNMGYNNINGIASSLNNNGKVNVVPNPNKNIINATVLSKDNRITPQEVENQIGDTIKTAEKTNSEVNVTGVQVPNNTKEIGKTQTPTESLYEQITLTKSEMNKILRKL